MNPRPHKFVNITQMLSSLTYMPMLKWLDNLSPLSTPTCLLIRVPTAATAKQTAAQSPTAATCTQQMTPTADAQPLTGKTDVAPHQSGHVSKAPQCT